MQGKILLVSGRQSIFVKPSLKYLAKLGYQPDFFDEWQGLFLSNENYLMKLLKVASPSLRNKLLEHNQKRLNRSLEERVKHFKPDYLLVLKGKNVDPATVKKISQSGVKTINWFPDATTNWRSIETLAPAYDYFFTYDPYILKMMKEIGLTGGHYLPFAADLEKDADYPDKKDYRYDLAFIGSYEPGLYDGRVKYLSQLADLDLHIWGNKNWLKTSLAKFYHGRPKDEEMLPIYQKSKIVINIDQQIPEEEGINLRPFEVTAAGSFLLNDPIKADIGRLFKDGEEVVVFKSNTDLRNKVEYYLAHSAEREKIARAGFERTKAEHTYLDRFQQMFKVIAQ